ncbi:cation:proton antiporter [Gordonia neofelifaecis]|uniref:Sodium/hydrogen exchanger n=1 Tax=Gordonia neofelifaecis NRRL B-59395 TaxID=644548 RepID=F1YL48_9ACTN|nr:cation:proton antiporter [Gordonia neofelifaecis]EGD54508.1 sodium/hydrogen exchanger [Gordonia neofelifaecis NRRL B-59395]
MTTTATALLVVPLLMLAAPILARLLAPWVKIPVVVFELGLGVVAGPALLGWVGETELFSTLSDFGVNLLFFIAGTEMTRSAIRGRTAKRAWLGWLLSIGLGVAAGFAVSPGLGAIIIGISLASTALGTLLPILRDSGELNTPFGTSIGAIGAAGEFGPIIAISLFLGGRSLGTAGVVLLVFGVIALAAILHARRTQHHRLHRFVEATLHTSAQFAVRAVLAILALMVFLTVQLGIDMLLGAFTAGIVWKLMIVDAEEETQRSVEAKIDAVAFGFLVPVFFVYTGVKFDLQSLLDDPKAFLWIPVVLVALLVVRGVPSMLAAPEGADRRERIATGLYGATGLPIIAVVTEIGVQQDVLTTTQGAILVGAGVLSVLLFPLAATALRPALGKRDPSAPIVEE